MAEAKSNQEALRVRLSAPLFAEVYGWLIHEAELLDNNKFDEWLALLSEDVVYTMPVRATVYRSSGDGVCRSYSHFEESFGSIQVRVNRLVRAPSAWSEEPPSRTRRFVTNIRVDELGDGEIGVKSNVLVMRNRWDMPSFEIIAAERRDVLRRSNGGGFKLVKREVIIDQSSLGTGNLGVFL